MEVIYPKTAIDSEFTFDQIKKKGFKVFLAGPCPRKDYDNKDWRNKLVSLLNEALEGQSEAIIFNPTNKYFVIDKETELKNQTEWEKQAMEASDVIAFWLDRSDDMPGFTTNVEIGYWIGRKDKNKIILIGCPKGCTKNANDYIILKAKEAEFDVVSTLEELVACLAVIECL